VQVATVVSTVRTVLLTGLVAVPKPPLVDSTARAGRPREDLEWLPLDDEICVYDPRSQRVLVLNATAATIWTLTAERDATAAEVAERTAAIYRVHVEEVQEAVLSCLRDWRDQGLLV